MTKAMAMTMPQIIDLNGWTSKNNGTAWVAHFDKQFFDEVCQMTTWKFSNCIWGSDNNNSQQQWILLSSAFT